MKKALFTVIIVGLFLLNATPLFAKEKETATNNKHPIKGTAIASWYGLRFHGRMMASGMRFDMYNPMIVAHKTLPLWTPVRITNPKNGRTILAFVLDRGPYIRGRSFDLSYAAARELGLVAVGVQRVHFVVEKIRG